MATLHTSPEYLAFLASIIARPDDDAPRLAFADWLEEQGEVARAGFVRKQIEEEVATLRLMWLIPFEGILGCQPHHCCRYAEKRAAKVVALNGTSLTFRRGFIDAVTCDWPTWRDHGDAILAAQPVTEVTLTGLPYVNGIGGLAEQYLRADNFEGTNRARRQRCEVTLRDLWPRVRAWRLPG